MTYENYICSFKPSQNNIQSLDDVLNFLRSVQNTVRQLSTAPTKARTDEI